MSIRFGDDFEIIDGINYNEMVAQSDWNFRDIKFREIICCKTKLVEATKIFKLNRPVCKLTLKACLLGITLKTLCEKLLRR
jgi:hypothetical protein